MSKVYDRSTLPVSYTHLDVYKRQGLGVAQGLGSAADQDQLVDVLGGQEVGGQRRGRRGAQRGEGCPVEQHARGEGCLLYTSRCV